MNQPDFRQLLNSLSYSAWECRLVLNSGPGGWSEAEVNEAFPYHLSDSGVDEWVIKDWIRNRLERIFQSNDSFTDLGCKMDEVLSFFQNRWLAGVADSKAINDLWDHLRLIEKLNHGRSGAILGDLKRIAGLVESILDGKAMSAKEPRSSWQCPNGHIIKVAPRLQPALEAYRTDLPDYDLGKCDYPRDIQADLKKVIQEARNNGYQPDPNRWPRSEGKKDGTTMLYFNGQEDGNRRNQGKG